MIASVAFRNFKALRATGVVLGPFNLVIGPNGSGKTSLMEAILRLNAAAHTLPEDPPARHDVHAIASSAPEVEFRFSPPHEALAACMRYKSEGVVGSLSLTPPDSPAWPALRTEWSGIRGYVLDHTAMSGPALRNSGAELAYDGANIAAVLAHLRASAPEQFSALTAELLRIMPEFRSVELTQRVDARVEFGLRLADNGLVTPSEMSQGMLYLVAMLALAFNPAPPPVLCIEDVDRGIHPRMLREVRDTLYRLSHPASTGSRRTVTQVIVTTHSPFFIDLFREHPEEVILSQKHGRAARFQRLVDRPDLPDLLREGSLGDMWYTGILGGVPEEP